MGILATSDGKNEIFVTEVVLLLMELPESIFSVMNLSSATFYFLFLF